MKKLISLLLVLSLLSLSPAVSADQPKIVDEADLLTSSEEQALEARARAIVQKYGMDVVILTVDSTDGQFIESFADDYYDNNGYGLGSDYSGVLLMLAMNTREWAISTCGGGIYAVTDYGIQMLFSKIADDLSMGDYYSAFDRYLEELETYYEVYAAGDTLDGFAPEYDGPGSFEPGTGIYYEDSREFSISRVILTSLVIGAVVGAVALWIMRSGMKTAKRQSGAVSYLTNGSVHFLKRQDFYLYSRTSRTTKPQNNGGSGNGSRVHRSSGGRRHGGGSGRF